MTTQDISISQNRLTVPFGGKTAQFVVWDLQPSQHKDLEIQVDTSFSICQTLADIENHLRINGFDARLEDIY